MMPMRPPSLDILKPEGVALDLQGRTEAEAIMEVARELRADPGVRDFGGFCDELFSREKLSPTALGSGVAFPHARTDHVSRIVAAVGRSREGVWFENCGENVHLIFVIGTPRESVREYLGLLATLARLLKQNSVREQLMQAATPEDFLAALRGGA